LSTPPWAGLITIRIDIFANRPFAIAIFAMLVIDDQIGILRKVGFSFLSRFLLGVWRGSEVKDRGQAPVSTAVLPAPTDRRSASTESHVERAVVPAVIDVDPRSIDILNRAEDEHYRLTACALCGGPELHAKTKPAAKCLRCGHYRMLERITPQATRQRCRRCREIFWAVLKMTTCEDCRGKWRLPD
jgi:hypothetical protein